MPSFVDGWTAPVSYQLFTCGPDACGPINLAAATCVALYAHGTGDVLMPIAGTVTVTDAAWGLVLFSPASCDLSQDHALYHIRFRIVDGLGKVSFVPQEEPETWTVRRI